MNFDVFENIENTNKELLLNNCRAAERNIMISPYNAISNSRAALEVLCKSLIKENGVEQIKPENGQPNLSTMIETCLVNKLFGDGNAATLIRKYGNDTLHANKGSQRLHIVNTKNVEKAIEAVKSLYEILSDVFKINVGFDIHKIPFGFYEIVRAIPKANNEIIHGDYNYFTRDPKGNYYYFQVFHRNSSENSNNELGERGVLTGKKIKEDKNRRSYLLDVHYPSNLLAESDRDYIAYSVYPDSFLLSELNGQLSERQTVQVALDLLNVLQELHNVGSGIHLRNIQPGNVIITPNEEDYMAGIVNMETAKIEGYDATVYFSMKDLLPDNVYIPRIVREANDGTNIQWDKVDVYSIAVVMLYCREKLMVKDMINTDELYDYFTDELADILCEVLDSSINEIPGVEEFKERLEYALAEL